ncbi:MAG: tetratricopeptide repeat protein [Myxococcaceae bacterium]
MSRESVFAAVKVLETVLRKWHTGLAPEERTAQYATGQLNMAELIGESAADILEAAVQGFRAHDAGRAEEAKAIFAELCERDAEQPMFRAALGAACLALSELDDAEAHLTDAIEMRDDELVPYVNRGVVYLRQGRYREAINDLEHAAKIGRTGDGPPDPLAERARLLAAAANEVVDLSRASGITPPVPELDTKPKRKSQAPKRTARRKK